MLLGRPLLAVGQLVAGGGQRDLGVVLPGDVLEGAAQRDQRAARQHRLSEDPDLPDHRGAGPHDAEHRHGGLPALQQLLLEPADGRAVGPDHEAVQLGHAGSATPAAGSSPKSANAPRVQRTVPAANCSSQPPRLAEPLRMLKHPGRLLGLARHPPGEHHPAEEGTACRSAIGVIAARRPARARARPARCRAPGRPGEQAVPRRRPGRPRAGSAGRSRPPGGRPGRRSRGSGTRS